MSSDKTFLVRFKTRPDPDHEDGIIMQFEEIGNIAQVNSPLKVVYEDEVRLSGAFLKAGIYLHSFGRPDEERNVMPDPEKHYEVTDDNLRNLGFDIPT
jgi:hypothetical protein